MAFREFDEYERLIAAAARLDSGTLVAVLLGGDAGLRAGEMRVLEWTDIDFKARMLFAARSEWQGQIGTTKSNRLRMVPMTTRLSEALRKHRHLKSDRVRCQAGDHAESQRGPARTCSATRSARTWRCGVHQRRRFRNSRGIAIWR